VRSVFVPQRLQSNVADNQYSRGLQQTNRWPTLHSTFESTLSVVSQPGVRGGVVSRRIGDYSHLLLAHTLDTPQVAPWRALSGVRVRLSLSITHSGREIAFACFSFQPEMDVA
jgi:hypothetical protein